MRFIAACIMTPARDVSSLAVDPDFPPDRRCQETNSYLRLFSTSNYDTLFPRQEMQHTIQRILFIALVLGVSIFWRQKSLASVIVEQPWMGNINGEDSNVTGQQVAEYFSMPTTATVESLQWYGVGVDGDLGNISTEAFQIRIYGDTSNPPGQARTLGQSPDLFPFYSSNIVATLQYTGRSTFVPANPQGHELALFSFAENLISPILLTSGTTYWLSILGNDSTEFLWAEGGVGADVFRPGGLGNGSPWLENSSDEVYVTFALNDTPIDEPSSFVILGSALILALWTLRARLTKGV